MRAFTLTFILIFSSARSTAAAGSGSQRDFLLRYGSERVEILPPHAKGPSERGHMPHWLHWLLTDFLGRDPESGPKDLGPGCQPDDLEEALRSTRIASKQAAAIEAHFRHCESQLETGVRNPTLNSFGQMSLNLVYDDHPFMSRVLVKLPGGVRMRGLLALKGDAIKRPFVVVRLGIFSNIDEFIAESFLIAQLFEQGPANVLVFPNSTGADYIAENPGFNPGGAIEGFQNLQIARLLRDPREPLSALVGSLRFVGISLGGNGLFQAAALDRLQPSGPWIDGYTALCPVVHLRPTFERGSGSTLWSAIFDLWAQWRLQGLGDRLPEFGSLSLVSALKGRRALMEATDYAEKSYPASPGLTDGLTLPPDWPRDFAGATEPWAWFHGFKAPFLVLATEHDDLVPPDLNARAFDQWLKTNNENAAVVMFREGFHCTLPIAYDWATIGALMNGTVLSTDASWKPQTVSLDMDLGEVVDAKAVSGPAKISYQVEWGASDDFVPLRVRVETAAGRTEFSMSLPLSEFDFRARDAKLNRVARSMVERWLHARLRLALVPKEGRTFLRVTWPQAR